MASEIKIEKLLGHLNECQRSLVEEYCKLQNSQHPSKIERLCSIWEAAQTDPVLCRCLEFIDDFCSFPLEEITYEEHNHQTYQSEYLVSQLQAKLDQEEGRIPIAASEGFIWLVECPDRQNLGAITLSSDDPEIVQQFKDQICGRCQTLYSVHNWKLLAEQAEACDEGIDFS
jgi:hypothetical protein